MMISYCRVCLPEKVVIAFGRRRVDVDVPHDIHPQPSPRNGLFSIPDNGPVPEKTWKTISVEGNDEQTKANIVTHCGDQFE